MRVGICPHDDLLSVSTVLDHLVVFPETVLTVICVRSFLCMWGRFHIRIPSMSQLFRNIYWCSLILSLGSDNVLIAPKLVFYLVLHHAVPCSDCTKIVYLLWCYICQDCFLAHWNVSIWGAYQCPNCSGSCSSVPKYRLSSCACLGMQECSLTSAMHQRESEGQCSWPPSDQLLITRFSYHQPSC